MLQRLNDLILRYAKTACLLAGVGTSLAFLTHPVIPALCLIGVLLVVLNHETSPRRAALMCFLYAMGFFCVSLYWVQNALGITLPGFWIGRVGTFFSLPVLLTPLWMLAGYASVRFMPQGSLARSLLFTTLLALAEYGRAFFLSGFPWNLFAYAWADVNAMIQVSAIGGVFFLNALTIFWAMTPAMLWLGRHNKKIVRVLSAVTITSMALSLIYGGMRLSSNPTVLRSDTAAVILQPNIPQADKWRADKQEENFYRHINLSKAGLKDIRDTMPDVKTVAVIWPETALEESVVFEQPKVPEEIVGILRDQAVKKYLITGLMRQSATKINGAPGDFFNSVTILQNQGNKLSMVDLYDKVHLVPFGEYIPSLEAFGIKPLTGFAGFKPGGAGAKVMHASNLPSFAAIICYEAIFPWSIDPIDDKGNADWIINVSNDGWYGNTTGPEQHLVMTRFRAVEQGLPVLRSTTTGISAVIDSYGRMLQNIPYNIEGYLVTALPVAAERIPHYRNWYEAVFFILIASGLALSARLRRRAF